MDRQDSTGRWGARRGRPEASGPSPGGLILEKPQFLLRPVQCSHHSGRRPWQSPRPWSGARPAQAPALAQPQLGPGEDSLLPGETVRSGRVGDTWPSQGSLLTPLPLTLPQTRSSRLCHFICHLPPPPGHFLLQGAHRFAREDRGEDGLAWGAAGRRAEEKLWAPWPGWEQGVLQRQRLGTWAARDVRNGCFRSLSAPWQADLPA